MSGKFNNTNESIFGIICFVNEKYLLLKNEHYKVFLPKSSKDLNLDNCYEYKVSM